MFAAWMWPDRYLTNSSFLDAEIHCPLANTNSHRTMLLSVFPRLLHDNLVWRIVMKICRAVCSSCFYVFGACLFSCRVSEVFFLLYFLFFFFSHSYCGKEIREEGESCAMCVGKSHAYRLILFSCQGGWVKKELLSGNLLSPAELDQRVVNGGDAKARADPSIATWNGLEMADRWGSSNDLIRRVFGPNRSQFAPLSFNCHGLALGVL